MSWDSVWYRTIALHGYTYSAASPTGNTVAFAPIYPLIERAWVDLTGISVNGFAIVSNILLQAAAACVLFKVLEGYHADRSSSIRWLGLYLVSPPVVFNLMGYYDSLFYLLMFLTVLFMQQKRRWWMAGAIALMIGLDPLGYAFAIGFVIWSLLDLYSQKTLNLHSVRVLVAQSLLCLIPEAAYAAYLQSRFGNAMLFYTSFAHWEHPISVSKALIDILTFQPVRVSILNWAAYPYTPAPSYMIDAICAIAVFTVLIGFVAVRRGLSTYNFWILFLSFLLAQYQAARYGAEYSFTRLVLPVAFAAASIPPLRKIIAQRILFSSLFLVFIAVTVIYLQRLATGQWVD